MLTIYHNPRCSKSRSALALTQDFANTQGLALNIVDYQKTPLTRDELTILHHLLNATKSTAVREMVRDGEEAYQMLNLATADDNRLLDALAAHPILLQRPIVVYNDNAVIARPPENVADILTA